MPLSVGDKPGPYKILAPIGAGGMEQVYKARDTRLDVLSRSDRSRVTLFMTDVSAVWRKRRMCCYMLAWLYGRKKPITTSYFGTNDARSGEYKTQGKQVGEIKKGADRPLSSIPDGRRTARG